MASVADRGGRLARVGVDLMWRRVAIGPNTGQLRSNNDPHVTRLDDEKMR
jgi:hypothetical protein